MAKLINKMASFGRSELQNAKVDDELFATEAELKRNVRNEMSAISDDCQLASDGGAAGVSSSS